MDFPLDKILSGSAEEYCKSKSKNLGDYNIIGVHVNLPGHYIFPSSFANNVPENAEVIVNYREHKSSNFWGSETSAHGDALILKNSQKP